MNILCTYLLWSKPHCWRARRDTLWWRKCLDRSRSGWLSKLQVSTSVAIQWQLPLVIKSSAQILLHKISKTQAKATSLCSTICGKTCTRLLLRTSRTSCRHTATSSTMLSSRMRLILLGKYFSIQHNAKIHDLLCLNWCARTFIRKVCSIAQKRFSCIPIRTASSISALTTLARCFSKPNRQCRRG